MKIELCTEWAYIHKGGGYGEVCKERDWEDGKVYCPIEDSEKKELWKLTGMIVDRDADDPCFAKVFTGKKVIDVHIGQVLNIGE